MEKTVNILGIRGIPAAHGGFETFAQHFSLWLVERGWRVVVYCQHQADDETAPQDGFEDEWQGVHRIHLRVKGGGSLSTISFDLKAVRDVLKRPGIDLVLGYNTALFSMLQRLKGRKVLMNMDGIEWKRDKWSIPAKIWFWINELIGAHICTVPIADHPEIACHLRRHGTRGIEVIPYGSARIDDASVDPVRALGLEPGGYLISIARIEPENSILEIVRSFSSRTRKTKLVVLGKFRRDDKYHIKVKQSASEEVIFPGAIYDPTVVRSLRFHAAAYVHGHQVGGTNPSLVEALGAGNAIIAHNNRFNRWVAGDQQFYFADEQSLDAQFELVIADPTRRELAQLASRSNHETRFTLGGVHEAYHDLMLRL